PGPARPAGGRRAAKDLRRGSDRGETPGRSVRPGTSVSGAAVAAVSVFGGNVLVSTDGHGSAPSAGTAGSDDLPRRSPVPESLAAPGEQALTGATTGPPRKGVCDVGEGHRGSDDPAPRPRRPRAGRSPSRARLVRGAGWPRRRPAVDRLDLPLCVPGQTVPPRLPSPGGGRRGQRRQPHRGVP